MVKKNKQDIAKIEQDRKEKLDADYAFYFENMEARISAGEKLEIKPFDTWVRKAIKTMPDTSTVEIQVSGDSGETKHARFVRIKNMRMAKILILFLLFLLFLFRLMKRYYFSAYHHTTIYAR